MTLAFRQISSDADRLKNARRLAAVARLLVDAGVAVTDWLAQEDANWLPH
jgi:adenylylsulfate kinase-like enzyme